MISGNTTTPTADGSNARAVAGQVATGGAGFTEGTSGNTTKASAVGADSHVFAIACNTQVPCRVPDRNPGGGGTTRENLNGLATTVAAANAVNTTATASATRSGDAKALTTGVKTAAMSAADGIGSAATSIATGTSSSATSTAARAERRSR